MRSLTLHNTLGGAPQRFVPLEAGRVTFYSCGPTVYDFAHIGNFRSFLTADLLRRWLENPLCRRVAPDGALEADPLDDLGAAVAGGPAAVGGYRVTHVMNLTDVGHMTDDAAIDGGGEDKMEAASKRLLESKKSGKLPPGAPDDFDPTSPWDIARFYADAFVRDARTLGLKVAIQAEDDPTLQPRATERMPQILQLVIELMERGHAYLSGEAVYFDTASFPDYGALSGNTPDEIRSGAGGRVSGDTIASKKHPADFMLWKHDPSHTMRWHPSDVFVDDAALADRATKLGLGEGYPGWHAECSAMAIQRLGEQIDIHSGGEDLIFPHHECEIAQSRCVTGKPTFATFWIHTRFLRVEGKKMSKSAGNFFTAREIMDKGFGPSALRLALVNTHYRQNANFTEQGLKDAASVIARWRRFLEAADASDEAGAPNADAARSFADAMNDDQNAAGAIGAINTWVKETREPTRADAALMRMFDAALGVLELDDNAAGTGSASDDAEHDRIDGLVAARQEARKNKDFAEADRLRGELDALGVEVTDTPDGPRWSRRATL